MQQGIAGLLDGVSREDAAASIQQLIEVLIPVCEEDPQHLAEPAGSCQDRFRFRTSQTLLFESPFGFLAQLALRLLA